MIERTPPPLPRDLALDFNLIHVPRFGLLQKPKDPTTFVGWRRIFSVHVRRLGVDGGMAWK